MTFAQKMEDVLREGERKGKLEGRQEGEAKLGLLISKLLAASRLCLLYPSPSPRDA